MFHDLYLEQHCLVDLLVLVIMAGCNLRAQFVVCIMKCVDEERHET